MMRMKSFAALLLAAFLSLLVTDDARAAQSCSSMPAGTAGSGANLWVLDPATLPSIEPEGFDLRLFIAQGGLFRAPEATGIVHDGTSAALLIFASPVDADVCFAAGADLVFEPYAPGFRAAVSPTRQAGNWTVPAAQLMAIDGRYYAAVLVETVSTPFVAADATPSIAAGQCCWTTVAKTLADQVPPVVLIHGLWGDSDSLSSVQQYLDGQSPWNRTKISYVQPIQYSITQPFDGPEPATTLNSEIANLLAQLEARHVVAGRVDLVAHSMGGLVARHFAGLAGYQAPRNRNQGAFHTVVTIDTPELGSALAPFLLANWNSKLEAPFLSTPYTIWSAACGLFSSENVEECFESLGMPLAATNAPLDSGAVYSLTPNGPSLTSSTLAPVQIPGAAARLIDATAPSNGALAFELNNLIAAVYSNPSSAPTVNSLLQNLPNDAIVTVASQTATGMPPIQSNFTGLSHTVAPDGDILDGLGLNDANVLDANSVNVAVGCWLVQITPGACVALHSDVVTVASAEQAPGGRPAEIARGRMVLDDRLALTAPAHLALAQPADLPLRLTTPGLIRLTVRQHDDVSGAVKTQSLAVDRMAGTNATATVTPMLFGQVTFTVTGVFSDGAVSTQRFTMVIDPPAAAPASFQGDVNGEHIYLNLSVPGVYRMFPAATFTGIPGKVDLRGHVDYALAPNSGTPVVSLGADGTLQALQPGNATIEASFGNAVDEIAVTVVP
jgi:pimeloyl-ACP methyl ester carboxylesterase